MDDDELADDELALEKIRRLGHTGDEEAAIDVATSVASAARDPKVAGMALILKLGSLLNLGRTAEWAAELDHAFEVVTATGDHALLGGFHAVAGAAVAQSSFERRLRHLVLSTRELDQVEQPSRQVVDAWYNLAVSYSYAGFHAQAMATAERTYATARAVGLAAGEHAQPEVAVRRAVSLDHQGDTDGCVRGLRDALVVWSRRTDPENLGYAQRCYYGYAAVRLRALGEDCPSDLAMPEAEFPGWEVADLRLLARAAAAIAHQRPADALACLADRDINPHTLGAAESARLRALAYATAGDYRAALAADRDAARLAAEGTQDLRNRLVDATGTQLDHEALRRTMQQYVSQALTDPLTGLPNRRHFDQRVTQVAEQRIPTAVGVIDLDGFKAVNTAYGHLTGDLVLQRVAAILARTVRHGDFVARYGGDEFVAVLPHTDLATAYEVGSRIAAAVAHGGWDALVAGTPVTVTIGWAELTDPQQLVAALQAADRAMFARKECRRSVSWVS